MTEPNYEHMVPKGVIKPALDENTFAELEKDFDDVLQNISNEKSLDKFKDEYSKLMRALKKSHESEKRLMRKCRELKAEIISNSAKVSHALKLSSDDASAIAELKKEVEKAWKLVDDAVEKESKGVETINALKSEINNLTKLIEQGSSLNQTGESINDLNKKRDRLQAERDNQVIENQKLREQIEDVRNQVSKLQNEKLEAQVKINELTTSIQVKNNEAQREARKRDRMDKDLKHTQAEVEAKLEEINRTTKAIEKLRLDLKMKEEENRSIKIHFEQSHRQLQINEQKLKEVQEKYDTQAQATELVRKEVEKKNQDLRRAEQDYEQALQENRNLKKQMQAARKSETRLEDERREMEAARDRLKQEIVGFERQMDGVRKNEARDKKICEELTRERDLLNKNLLKSANDTHKQVQLVKLHEQSKRNLDQEIANYREEAVKQRKVIYQLEKERDRYINEASELTQKVLLQMEEVKTKEMEIFDFKKRIAEAETKLHQQQNLYEAVRSDRNLYSKNLIEAQDEIADMRRKLKIVNHQINQLKDEVSGKEAHLVKENIERQRLEKEKEQLNSELRRLRGQIADSRSHIEAQETETRKLHKMITETDAERGRQKKELLQIVNERDILGTQLVRRNDELALLYEKIRIQSSILNKGEAQYAQRLEDVRVMKIEIKRLRRKKEVLQASARKSAELKREVCSLQRELLKQRTRCRALEEELENPINVHRWRKLEGDDPATYEIIRKIQVLQKRLIAKTEEVVEKELLIQDKEKLYIELKQILARQPGPGVAEQLHIYQTTLKNKNKQMTSMTAELNMYDSQIKDYKYEIEKLSGELADMKKKYFVQKKRKQAEHEQKVLRANNGVIPAIEPKVQGDKFTGGGFNLSAGQQQTSA